MKIGISASLARAGRSGIGRYLCQLIPALVQACPTHEYVVFAPPGEWPQLDVDPRAVRIHPIASPRAAAPDDVRWHHFALPKLAHDLKLDVLHIPTQRRMLWRKPCALVTTVHDVGPFRSPRSPQSRGSCPNTLFRALARRQDALIALDNDSAAQLASCCGLEAGRVTAIPIGIDPLRFHLGDRQQAAAAIVARHRLHPPFFLCVGRLEAATHNQLRVLEAFTRFKTSAPSPWQLVFVGDDGGRASEIRAHVARSPYGADVRLVGHVPAEELGDWYRAAGVVISVRRRDGFAHALREAMACGTPVVSTDSAAAREICGDAALYCDPDNASALEHVLVSLAGDETLRRRLSAAGAQRTQTMTWQDVATATASAYLRALQRFTATLRVSARVPDTAPAS